MKPDFLTDAWETERLKTLGLWAQVPAADFDWRPEPRARSPHEHMVHQCLSEDGWMTRMLGLPVEWPALPDPETIPTFIEHYGRASARRLDLLRAVPDGWWDEETGFFDARRTKAWVMVRRLVHSAHHRGQLSAMIRARGVALYSTYGPTADTGGLAANGAVVIYPDPAGSIPLPGPGVHAPTERPLS